MVNLGPKSRYAGLRGKALMEAVRANRKILDACKCHEFHLGDVKHITDRVQCIHCGGEMTSHDAYIWTEGFLKGLQKGKELLV